MKIDEALKRIRLNTDDSHFDIKGPGEDEKEQDFTAIRTILDAAEKWAAIVWWSPLSNEEQSAKGLPWVLSIPFSQTKDGKPYLDKIVSAYRAAQEGK